MKTRAEQIRAMNDEQLADFLYGLDVEAWHFCRDMKKCQEVMEDDGKIPDSWCAECLLRYLRTEGALE